MHLQYQDKAIGIVCTVCVSCYNIYLKIFLDNLALYFLNILNQDDIMKYGGAPHEQLSDPNIHSVNTRVNSDST